MTDQKVRGRNEYYSKDILSTTTLDDTYRYGDRVPMWSCTRVTQWRPLPELYSGHPKLTYPVTTKTLRNDNYYVSFVKSMSTLTLYINNFLPGNMPYI